MNRGGRRQGAFSIQRKLLVGTAAFVGAGQNENAASLLHTLLRISRRQQQSIKLNVLPVHEASPVCLVERPVLINFFPPIFPCLILKKNNALNLASDASEQ